MPTWQPSTRPPTSTPAVGHPVVTDGLIAAVGAGPAPRDLPDASYLDMSGCLITPGFVNTHHHLCQWTTHGLAVDDTLFGRLSTLPGVEEARHALRFARATGGPQALTVRGAPDMATMGGARVLAGRVLVRRAGR